MIEVPRNGIPESIRREQIPYTMAKHGFYLDVPEQEEDFSGEISYKGLEALPNHEKKIDRAVLICRMFLNDGVFIFDDFGNRHEDPLRKDDTVSRATQDNPAGTVAFVEDGVFMLHKNDRVSRDLSYRRAAQDNLRESIREKLGDEQADEYWKLRNNNYLRAGGLQTLMMSSVLDPLGNGLIGVDTPQAKRVCEIMARFPKIRKKPVGDGTFRYELSDPKFQWMVDRIVQMNINEKEVVTESTPYRDMTDEEKLVLVELLRGIARDFLHLVIKKEENHSVSGVGLEPTT
jgi:hypothetical protein